MAKMEVWHNRLICISVTDSLKGTEQNVTRVKKSRVVKTQNIKRHFRYHPKTPKTIQTIGGKTISKPSKTTSGPIALDQEAFEKMNHHFTIKTACQLYPSYSISTEDLGFLYTLCEVARKQQINPLRHLGINRKTRAKRCHDMKDILMSEIKTLMKLQVENLKKQDEIHRVMAFSLCYDHAFAPSIKAKIGCFTLSVRSYDVSKKETEEQYLPLKTFDIIGKGDQTAQQNADQILKIIEEIFEVKSSVAVCGDGGIVIPLLMKELKARCEKKDDLQALPSMTTICKSHTVFIIYSHGWRNTMDDAECGKEFNCFFPNHKPKAGKKLFFFGSAAKETELKTYLPYFLSILNHLDTPSSETAIRLTDYITGLQHRVVTDSVHKRKQQFASGANKQKFEEQLLQDINDQLFTSSDPFELFKARFYGESIEDESKMLKSNPLKIASDPGKKSRRMINMETALVKTIKFADCAVNHFPMIKKPNLPISSLFCRNVAEHAALTKHLISKADCQKANNITLYRILAITSKAALKLDDDDVRLYEDILSNPLVW